MMASHLPHMLSTRVLQPAPVGVRLSPSEFAFKRSASAAESGQDEAAGAGARRMRIWEFDPSLHCSIVGPAYRPGSCATSSAS